MVKARATNNLPMGIVVNRTMVTPNKAKKVPIVLVNTNSYNVWIHQPLLAADIVEVEGCPWDYQSLMSHDGNEIKISFCPVPTPEVQEEILFTSITNTGDSNEHEIQKNKARGQSLDLDPSLTAQILIFQRS